MTKNHQKWILNSLELIDGLLAARKKRGTCNNLSNLQLISVPITELHLSQAEKICKFLDIEFKRTKKEFLFYCRTMGCSSEYDFNFILKAQRSFLEICYDYDEQFYFKFTMETQLSLFRTLKHYASENLNLVSILKYFSAWPLAKFLGNDLPPNPGCENPYLVDRPLRLYIKQRLIAVKSSKNLKFFWTLLQGFKRACQEAPESFVFQSFVKHARTLKTEPSDYVETYHGHFQDRASIENEHRVNYRPKFDKIWKGIPKYRVQENLPISASACYELQRSNGGARASLIRYANDLDEFDFHDTIGDHVVLLQMIEVRPGFVQELRGLKPITLGVVKDFILRNHNEEFHRCQVSPVLEPLKVRLITKGPAAPYFYSRSMQKLMHSFLKSKPQFVPIGEPLREEHLYDMIHREEELDRLINRKFYTNLNFDQWVSGDYSAATDGLDINCTVEAFESVLEAARVPEDDKVILRRVLYNHRINYSDRAECAYPDDLQPFIQKTGQLMGSTLSFPILCVVNLVCYWNALKQYIMQQAPPEAFDYVENFLQRNSHLLPCLVNGDDILFRCNEEMYSIWKLQLALVGFQMSVGKNYIHRSTFTINSQLYTYNWEKKKIRSYNYYNPGLLFGQTSTMDNRRKEYESDKSPTAIYNKFIEGADNKERAHKRFIHYHKKNIDLLTDKGRISLHLPEHLGGLGFNIPEGMAKLTRGQMIVANHLSRNPINSILNTRNEYRSSDSSCKIEPYLKMTPCGPLIGPLPEGVRDPINRDVTISNTSLYVDSVTRLRPLPRKQFYNMCGLWEESYLLDEARLLRIPAPRWCYDYRKSVTIVEEHMDSERENIVYVNEPITVVSDLLMTASV